MYEIDLNYTNVHDRYCPIRLINLSLTFEIFLFDFYGHFFYERNKGGNVIQPGGGPID